MLDQKRSGNCPRAAFLVNKYSIIPVLCTRLVVCYQRTMFIRLVVVLTRAAIVTMRLSYFLLVVTCLLMRPATMFIQKSTALENKKLN